jgi:hypothetical protein
MYKCQDITEGKVLDGLAGLSRVKNNISRRCGHHLQDQFEQRWSLPCLPSRETALVVVRRAI